MANYPREPQYEECVITDNGCDPVRVYRTSDGLVFICGPYADPPCFDPRHARKVCEAIMRAAGVSSVGV